MAKKIVLHKDRIANARILAILGAALASLAWLAGGGGAERHIPAEGIALLAEMHSGAESASYQAIANPVLNAALDAYGRADELYDVSRWHESFAAYFDGASRNLLDDALFFDLDDPGRKRLGIGEGIDNARARSIREAAIRPAVEFEGRLAWFGLPAEGGGPGGDPPRLCAARLVKRPADGAPIGVLVLLPDARRLAAAFERALGEEAGKAPSDAASRDGFAFLLGDRGAILAGTSMGGIGTSLEAAFPGGGRLLAQEALGMDEGSAELKVEGRRRPVLFSKVPGTGWTLVASAADVPEGGSAALRWALFLGFALAMALALKRALGEGSAASAAAVIAVAEGAARPYTPPASPPAAPETLAAGANSGAAPAWFRDLAPRERSIVLLLAAGKSNKEIAFELGLAEQTVKNRLGLVYERLGVRDRVSAALIVSRARLRDD